MKNDTSPAVRQDAYRAQVREVRKEIQAERVTMTFGDLFSALVGGAFRRVAKSVGGGSGGFFTSTDSSGRDEIELTNDFDGFFKAYRLHAWTRRCVDVRAENVSAVRLKLFDDTNPDEPREIKSHAILDLLNTVNPFTMNHSDLFYALEQDQGIYHNSMWYLNRLGVPGGTPRAIYRLDPRFVKKVPSETRGGFIEAYKYETRNSIEPFKFFPPEDVVDFHRPNPGDLFWGISPLEPILSAISATLNAERWNENFFKNGTELEGFISIDDDVSPETRREVRAGLEEQHRGPSRWRRLGIFGRGFKFTPRSSTPKDAEWSKLENMARDKTCAGLSVPVFLVSGHEAANFATATEQRASFHDEFMVPELVFIQDVLNNEFVPQWGDPRKLRLEFDIDSLPVVKARRRELAELEAKEVGVPTRTVNEHRASRGDEPVDGGDTIFVPVSMVPLGEEIETGAEGE